MLWWNTVAWLTKHFFQRMWAVSFQVVSRTEFFFSEIFGRRETCCTVWTYVHLLWDFLSDLCYGQSEGRTVYLILQVTWNITPEITFCVVWGQKGPLDDLVWSSVCNQLLDLSNHPWFEPSYAQTASLHLETIRRIELLPSIDSSVPIINSLAVLKCEICFWFDLTFSFFLSFLASCSRLWFLLSLSTPNLRIPLENNAIKKSKNAFPEPTDYFLFMPPGIALAIFATFHWAFIFSCSFIVTSKSFSELPFSRV